MKKPTKGNIRSKNGNYFQNRQKPRFTRKTNVVGNPRWASNVQGPRNKHKIYNPNDVAKTTIKETNIHDSDRLNMKPDRPSMIQVKDPNDVAKVTIKETNIHDSEKLNMKPNRPSMIQVKDPNDVAKVTIKETNIHDSDKLNMKPDRPSMIQVKDPSDVAKVTIKETNIHDSDKLNMKPDRPSMIQVKDPNDVTKVTIKQTTLHNSEKLNMNPNRPSKNIVKDKNDKAKVTIKETTQLEDYISNPKEVNDNAYINKSNTIEAYTTHRETTTTDYTGDAKGENIGGYKVSNPEAKNTVRQFTSDYEYEGIAGPSSQTKPLSYDDIYNSTIKSVRQEISKGRTPTTQGAKKSISGENMNVNTNKFSNENNEKVTKRGLTTTKVYNSIPQQDKCYQTTNKTKLPNQDRLDPNMLKAFKENPYTQSLHSHVFP